MSRWLRREETKEEEEKKKEEEKKEEDEEKQECSKPGQQTYAMLMTTDSDSSQHGESGREDSLWVTRVGSKYTAILTSLIAD